MIAKLKSLKSHQGFLRYFKNTFWLFSEKILRLIVGIFIGVWVARYLGPERFGLFAYAQSFVGLFAAIATLGLDGILIRELVKDETKRDVLLGTVFRLKLIGAFAVLIFLAIATLFTLNDLATNILIFIIASSTIFQSFNVIDFYFQSRVLSKYIVYANIISLVLSSIIKIILILNKAPLIAFAIIVAIDSLVLATGFLYFYFHNKLSVWAWKFETQKAKELLKDSWPLILSGMVIAVYMQIDQVMLKEMLNNKAVGQYAAAVKLSTAWYFIPIVIASSLFPAIINAKKTSEKLYLDRLQRLYSLMVWMAIAVALPTTFLGDWVVNLLYGNQFQQAGSVLVIHIWAGVFVALGIAQSKFWLANNLQKQQFLVTLVASIMNIVLNWIMIPLFGVTGSAIATLISYGIGAMLLPLAFVETRPMMKISYNCFILRSSR